MTKDLLIGTRRVVKGGKGAYGYNAGILEQRLAELEN